MVKKRAAARRAAARFFTVYVDYFITYVFVRPSSGGFIVIRNPIRVYAASLLREELIRSFFF